MIDWLISPAYAAEAAGPGPGFDILILVGFALIFYFMLWRPQSKRAKEHKQLVEGLAKEMRSSPPEDPRQDFQGRGAVHLSRGGRWNGTPFPEGVGGCGTPKGTLKNS